MPALGALDEELLARVLEPGLQALMDMKRTANMGPSRSSGLWFTARRRRSGRRFGAG